MSRIDEIRQKLKEWCSAGAPQPTILGIVKSVNEDEQTCVVEDDGLEYPNVRLAAVLTGSDGLTIIPTIGKYALCSRIEGDNEWFLVSAEEVFKYRLKIGQTVFEVTEGGIEINGGSLGGLLKLEATVERLNNIESDINTLKTIFSTWIPVPADGGAALKSASANWASDVLTETTTSDIENDKVKQ